MTTEDWKDIAIYLAGSPVKGKYCVFEGQVTVAAWNGTKMAQLGVLPAERLAKMLLRELALEGNEKSRISQGPLNGARRAL
jgi:hypothetical protein